MEPEQKFGLAKFALVCATILVTISMVVRHNPSSFDMAINTTEVSASMHCTFDNEHMDNSEKVTP